ncbi:MAG: glycosyltransferase family 4 protein [Chloroflexota bacterium]
MWLTLINQFYPPDLAPTGHLAASLAEHRAAAGDEVTVVTSPGGYVPESRTTTWEERRNPRVLRIWSPRLGKASPLKRIADYAAFYILAALRLLTLPRQDVIISLTTPPFIALTALLHKALHPSAKVVLWSMDCYPEVLERAGVLQSRSLASRLMRWLNRVLFRHLDHLVCLDSAMGRLLTSQYSPKRRPVPVSVISNWERLEHFPPDLAPSPWPAIATLLGLQDRFIILYLGNAGYGHRFETVLATAEALREEPVAFLFVGGGAAWPALEQERAARHLENVILHRYVPKEETPSVLASAHCGLITLRDEYLGVICPSKPHSYLAMGLPVLYVGPEGGNVDEAIRRFDCGLSLRHGDVEGMVAFIRRLMADREHFQRLRLQARRAFDEAYVDTKTLPQFDQVLEKLVLMVELRAGANGW